MPLVLRQPTLGELQKLSELCLRSKAVWGYDQAFIEAFRTELTLLPEDLIATRIVVAEDDNSLAGVAQVRVIDAEVDLLKLFIEPSRLRNGIGRILFRWATEQARQMGTNKLFIVADSDAAPFYRRMGALDVGIAPSGSIPERMLPKLALER